LTVGSLRERRGGAEIKEETHNLVARFGASRSRGGTRPFDVG
jgi:hypothetical protein